MDDGIYYIPAGLGKTSVRFHSFATDQDKEIAPVGDPNRGLNPNRGLTVSPDRKAILVTISRAGTNIMVVDNFR